MTSGENSFIFTAQVEIFSEETKPTAKHLFELSLSVLALGGFQSVKFNFEHWGKLYDFHAARNGSHYLNGHCFVSLMLSVPLQAAGHYLSEDFCALRGLSSQQTRFALGRRIRQEVFLAALVRRPEIDKHALVSLNCLQSLAFAFLKAS